MRTEKEILKMDISVVQKSVDRLEQIKKERKLNKKEKFRYSEDTRLLNKWKKDLEILKILEG